MILLCHSGMQIFLMIRYISVKETIWKCRTVYERPFRLLGQSGLWWWWWWWRRGWRGRRGTRSDGIMWLVRSLCLTYGYKIDLLHLQNVSQAVWLKLLSSGSCRKPFWSSHIPSSLSLSLTHIVFWDFFCHPLSFSPPNSFPLLLGTFPLMFFFLFCLVFNTHTK